jgi:hypothetical protein
MLLHFPNLAPADFQPWVNIDQARRAGKSVEQAAEEAAAAWGKGLTDWEITPERMLALKNSAQFTIYTPGSDAGIPVSILASFQAPPIPWESNRELLREKISGTVTAILGLVGLQDIDPVRSREHILLSNIFESAWSQGKDLDLSELILQTQTPPFSKLGVFDVNTFFPEKDRFQLAMLLNNILAAPAFQTWIEGQPLNIADLLFDPDGRPRHSVFYIAHLTDAERMFFVTLLYSAVESWMRSQPGTTTLRALLYFDEIFGYLPPISNPSSKPLMLRMLKQARAFGVGQVLVTQNPVDVDYKALSNAGTWFIGKLQTDQDKQRLLDGLESAMEGGMDRGEYDRLISTLGKRVFLLHNVHEKRPQVFQTRWAMNYLAGPLTRAQIPALNQMAGNVPSPTVLTQELTQQPIGKEAAQPVPQGMTQLPLDQLQPVPVVKSAVRQPETERPEPERIGSTTRPAVPAGVREYFLPNNLTFTQAFQVAGRPYPAEAFNQGLVYRPVLLGQAYIRFLDRKYNLDYEERKTILVEQPDRRGVVRWENYPTPPLEERLLDAQPDPQARFVPLEVPLTDAKIITALQKDFLDWAFRSAQVIVRANNTLAIFAGPDVSQAEFRKLCADAAREKRDLEAVKLENSFEKKLAVLEDKLRKEERELSSDETELSQRKMEEMGTHAENILGLLGGRRRRLTTSLSKRRMTAQAKEDVEESLDAIADIKKQIQALEKEKEKALTEINDRWGEVANEDTEISLAPLKKDVLLDFFGVAWMPYHRVQIDQMIEELPGYGSA